MNEQLLNTSKNYQRILNLSMLMKRRYDKAVSINLNSSSKFYRAYLEIVFRNEVLAEVVEYIQNMSSEVVYPECIGDASYFIVNKLDSFPECDKGMYSEYLDAALKLPDCKSLLSRFYEAMDVFVDYKMTSEELFFNQSVDMIAYGIDLLIGIREHICSVGKT